MKKLLISVFLISIAFQQLYGQVSGNHNSFNWKAATKSIVLPGMGQRYNGQQLKGNLYTIGATTGTVSAITAYGFCRYYNLKALNSSDINARSWYNNRSQLSWDVYQYLAVATGIIWTSAVLDAGISTNVTVALKQEGIAFSYYF